MKVAQFLIPGNFVDSYLYSGWLYLWDESGQVATVSLDAIADRLAVASNETKSVVKAIFWDNQALDDDVAVARAGRSPLTTDLAETSELAVQEVQLSELNPFYAAIGPDATVFDLYISYYRLFVSTEDLLFSVAADDPTDLAAAEPKVRIRHSCFETSYRWGSVAASCGKHGTWLLSNEFGFASYAGTHTEQVDEAPTVRHAWVGGSFLNFSDAAAFDVFTGTISKPPGKKRLVTDLLPASTRADDLLPLWASDMGRGTSLLSFDGEEAEGVEASVSFDSYVNAFGMTLFGIDDSKVFVRALSNWHGQLHGVGDGMMLGEVDGRVLSAAETDGGYVVEMPRSLHYLDNRGFWDLLNRETISLRSYQRSKRYRRMITATVDGGLLVSTLLGEHPYPRSERVLYPPR